jgi:hypothetical protein
MEPIVARRLADFALENKRGRTAKNKHRMSSYMYIDVSQITRETVFGSPESETRLPMSLKVLLQKE